MSDAAVQTNTSPAAREIVCAFVGMVVPDDPTFYGPAFSRAAQMFLRNFIVSISAAGLPPTLIISAQPVVSFPSKRAPLWVAKKRQVLYGIEARFASFLNVTPIKQLMISISSLSELLKWGRLHKNKKKLICVYNLTVPSGLFILLAGRLTGAKIVALLCDINIPGETVPNLFTNRLDFWMQRFTIPRLDGYLPICDEIMQELAPQRRYLRLDGGITEEIIDLPSRCHALDSQTHFVIVFAGKLAAINGLDILLDAFHRIKGDQYSLIIAGSGPMDKMVRDAAEKDPRIDFRGFLSFVEVLKIYQIADVLVSIRPTKSFKTKYLFPSKIMECLASGTPLIATGTGHIGRDFGHLCYLLENETSDDLANLLQRVADIPVAERESLAAKARSFMLSNRTWTKQGENVVAYLRSLFQSMGT